MPGADGQASKKVSSRIDGMPFEQWRTDFFADAELRGLLHNAEMMGDYALRLFWEEGTAPSVQAVLASEKKKPA